MTNVVALLAALLLKPALVVAAAMLIAALIRRRGAAARHAMWTGSVVALLALPLLSFLLPPLRVEFMDAAVAPLFDGAPPRPTEGGDVQPPGSVSAPDRSSGESRPAAVGVSFRFAGETLFSVWAIVALVLVARRLAAERSARRLIERGMPATGSLASRCAAVSRAHLRQAARVVMSEETPSPAVAGVFRPVVILPQGAEDWSDDEVDAVMVHELSHVERRDCLINLLADLTAAIYWCNPLVTYAARRVRAEGELACDEEALRAGSEPDAYAAMLLDFARTAFTRKMPRALTAAARPSELESRVIAVLGLRHPGAPLRRWMALGFAGMVPIVAVPVGCATLLAAPQVQQATTDPALTHPVPPGSSERLPLTIDRATLNAAARRALAGPDSTFAAKLVAALDHAPKHENDLIRERSAWALSLTRGNRLLEPVVEALDAPDWRMQSYAAWTTAVARERTAVPRLITLLKHPVWRVRAMASFALCEIAAPEAVDAMIAALSDDAWQVRLEAVEYLGSMENAATYRDRIRARLNDDHIAVRRTAEWALKNR